MAPARIDALGLRAWTGQPHVMGDAHLHADVELNLVPAGRADYLLAGRPLRLDPGRLYAFWGAIPHQLTALAGVKRLCWVTVGLREMLAWRLPQAFTAALLAGEVVVGGGDDGPLDAILMDRWAADWARGGAWRGQCGAEVATRLRRMALTWGEGRRGDTRDASDLHAPILVRVARVVTERLHEAVGVTEIAATVGVHPKYLATAFKRAAGMGVHEYLTRMRLGHAQHLLRTSQRSVTDIALGSGFGSLNAFYTAFRKHVGLAPERWRAGEPARFGF
jgi:AraC-like DNA-binding protein